MSAFAGTWYFDGRPIVRHEAEAISLALGPHGPDASGSHAEPGLFMVHRALHVTAEDRAERQPHRGREFVITWDGRLDNRSDLLMQLGAPARTSDVDLVALSYDRWKLDALPRLIGDWSCAIWDRSTRQLHLASDFMGNRPLFWRKTGECLRWATSLAAFPLEERTLDDGYILGFLFAGASPDRTPYLGIASLSSGHVLTCTASGVVTRTPYYQFPQVRLEYRDDRDYEERFRELFADAVGSRMRAAGPVWAELSGGLDSSSIVCMGAALLDQRRVATPALYTRSHIADQSPESTEERFIDAVIEATRLPGTKQPLSQFDPRPNADPIVLRHRSAAVWSSCKRMRQDGASVLLSGRMGDGITGNSLDNYPAVLEPLLRGRPLACLKEARAWSLASKRPVIEVLMTARHAFGTGRRYAAFAIESWLQNQRGTSAAAGVDEVFCLARPVGPEYVDDFNRYAMAAARSGPPWQQQILSTICRYQIRRSLTAWTPEPTVAYTYPFAHRPLVEFALTIPSRVLNAPGEPRRLMRRALEGLLPPRIHRRFSKGYAAPELARNFRSTATALRDSIETLHVVRHGYIDKQRLHARLSAFLTGADARVGNLWQIAVLEQWLAGQARQAGQVALETAV